MNLKISQSEKQQILEMHKKPGVKNYLNEEEKTPCFDEMVSLITDKGFTKGTGSNYLYSWYEVDPSGKGAAQCPSPAVVGALPDTDVVESAAGGQGPNVGCGDGAIKKWWQRCAQGRASAACRRFACAQFTAPLGCRPCSRSVICCTVSMDWCSIACGVRPPMCGVAMTRGCCDSTVPGI